MKINIIILNYNGETLLKECLPSIIDAASHASFATTVTVIDNLSTDKSLAVLKSFGDKIRVVIAKANLVLCSYNDVVAGLDDDVVILLNNDIKVSRDFVAPLAQTFLNHQDACFVAARSYLFDGKTYEGHKTKWWIRWGLFGATCHYPGYEKDIETPGYSMQAGILAFDRKKFLALGGYDDLYLPGRLEDSDICFRAWKRGWKGYYEPKSIIFHKGGATFNKKFGSHGTLIIAARNTYLFMWKNMTDPWILFSHICLIFPRILFHLLRGKTELLLGFIKALPRLPQAIRKRATVRAGIVKSDREVLNII